MQRKRIIKILIWGIILIVAATTAAYFFYEPQKPWLAFYIACCGGALVVNLAASAVLVGRNFKNQKNGDKG